MENKISRLFFISWYTLLLLLPPRKSIIPYSTYHEISAAGIP